MYLLFNLIAKELSAINAIPIITNAIGQPTVLAKCLAVITTRGILLQHHQNPRGLQN